MAVCNLCGSKTERIFKTKIEGAEMNVCATCTKLGRVIEEVKVEEPIYDEPEQRYQDDSPSTSTVNVIVSDYGRLVKQARERKGLKQEELAKMLAIKESLLHNIESSHFEPSVVVIEKLEKYLHIKLMQQIEDKPVNLRHVESGPMTLGDMIKKKMKK